MIAVVIPCYRVTKHILKVINSIGPEVSRIYVVDDACPDGSGRLVDAECQDNRVHIIWHEKNQGVGGAMKSGYQQAITDEMEIVVKIDGDGQMNPNLIHKFVLPILKGEADYTKGNRFYDLENLTNMPRIRIFGNAVLSIISKFSTGYWNIFDVTNGYTAAHVKILKHLPFSKISNRYFFETDILFRMNTIRACVVDIPMNAVYADEKSNLNIKDIIFDFLIKHIKNTGKRIFYNYFLRDMTAASLELIIGLVLFLFGLFFGLFNWINAISANIPTPSGTIMLAALPTIIGLQMLLAFINFDVSNTPNRPIHNNL